MEEQRFGSGHYPALFSILPSATAALNTSPNAHYVRVLIGKMTKEQREKTPVNGSEHKLLSFCPTYREMMKKVQQEVSCMSVLQYH